MSRIDWRATTFMSSAARLVDNTLRRMANGNLNLLINTCTLPCLATPDLPVGLSIEPTLDRNRIDYRPVAYLRVETDAWLVLCRIAFGPAIDLRQLLT